MSGNSADISKRYFQNCTVGSNPPWSASFPKAGILQAILLAIKPSSRSHFLFELWAPNRQNRPNILRRARFSPNLRTPTHSVRLSKLDRFELLMNLSGKVVGLLLSDSHIVVKAGSIDTKDCQGKIVSIMEGGIEAFERRKTIYQIWKAG